MWKVVVCLLEERPDLNVASVDVLPTGLGVVTGLDPSSKVLSDRYDEIVERYVGLDYALLDADKGGTLHRVPNDWNAVRELLPSEPLRRANIVGLVGRRALRWRPGKQVTLHREARLLGSVVGGNR